MSKDHDGDVNDMIAQEEFDLAKHFKEAWGSKCEEFEPDCAQCIAWRFYERSGDTYMTELLRDFSKYVTPERPIGGKPKTFVEGYQVAVDELESNTRKVLGDEH